MRLRIELAGGKPEQYEDGSGGINWKYLDYFTIELTPEQQKQVMMAITLPVSELTVVVE